MYYYYFPLKSSSLNARYSFFSLAYGCVCSSGGIAASGESQRQNLRLQAQRGEQGLDDGEVQEAGLQGHGLRVQQAAPVERHGGGLRAQLQRKGHHGLGEKLPAHYPRRLGDGDFAVWAGGQRRVHHGRAVAHVPLSGGGCWWWWLPLVCVWVWTVHAWVLVLCVCGGGGGRLRALSGGAYSVPQRSVKVLAALMLRLY